MLCDANKLTPEGCAWMDVALDPFPDAAKKVGGLPDSNGEQSLVLPVQRSISITRPTGTNFTGNWDCHIVQSPLNLAQGSVWYGVTWGSPSTNPYGGSAKLVSGQTSGTNLGPTGNGYEGCSISAVPAGDDTFNWTDSNSGQLDSLNVGVEIAGAGGELRRSRLIAAGFEVVNTTAEIYRQGAVTVYEAGNSVTPTSIAVLGTTGTILNESNGLATALPPSRLETAKLLPSAVTWEASKGCYVPSRLAQHPQPQTTQYGSVIAVDEQGHAMGYCCGTARDVSTAVTASNDLPRYHTNTCSLTGAYFTGLSPETVLTVTYRAYVEIFPLADPTMVSMCSPSPPLDSMALELYSRVLRDLPPGTVVGDNNSGDWFRRINSVLQSVVRSPIVTHMPGGAYVQDAAYIAERVDKAIARAQKKKAKPAPKPKRAMKGRPNFI